MVRQAKVFLFDEPFSNLDARLRAEMRGELKRLHQQLGTTTIYVTHDQEEAMAVGQRIVVLKDGLVQQCGGSQEVYANPNNRFVAEFIGIPPMNFFDGALVAKEGRIFFDEGTAEICLHIDMRKAHVFEPGQTAANITASVRSPNRIP